MNIAISIPNIETPISNNLKSPKPIKGFLSLSTQIPFDNHPSARGLKKDEKEEDLKDKFNINIISNNKIDNIEVNDDKKKTNSFKFTLNYIEEKIFQNEVYYEKNDNYSTKNSSNLSLNFIPEKKNTFTQKEKEFDDNITESIKKRESSDVIIKKFNKFATCK